MIEPERLLRPIFAELEACRVGWALVGGLAVSVRTQPRFTRDVDLAVAVRNDAEAEALVSALIHRGLSLTATADQTLTERLALASLTLPLSDDQAVVDLLFATAGIEPEIVAAAELMEVVPGISAPVAQVGHLLALKIHSRDDDLRPQDLMDLRALLGTATPEDLALARSALQLIEARGFARGKDLVADFRRLTDRA